MLARAGCGLTASTARVIAAAVARAANPVLRTPARLCAIDMIGFLRIRAGPRGPAAPSSVYDAVTPGVGGIRTGPRAVPRAAPARGSGRQGDGWGTTHLILGLTPR